MKHLCVSSLLRSVHYPDLEKHTFAVLFLFYLQVHVFLLRLSLDKALSVLTESGGQSRLHQLQKVLFLFVHSSGLQKKNLPEYFTQAGFLYIELLYLEKDRTSHFPQSFSFFNDI